MRVLPEVLEGPCLASQKNFSRLPHIVKLGTFTKIYLGNLLGLHRLNCKHHRQIDNQISEELD
jgi:hypothetical protein